MTEARVREAIAKHYPENNEALKRYVDIATSIGVERGLIGPREVPRIWSRHIANCLALEPLLGEGESVADVGSGAGLPGLVLAIVRPDLQVTLIESLLRRATFLTETVDQLGLADRVSVIRERAEDCQATFDSVVARAVAPLPKLIGFTAGLFPTGRLLALKGESAADEVAVASRILAKRGLVAEVLRVGHDLADEATWVVSVTKR